MKQSYADKIIKSIKGIVDKEIRKNQKEIIKAYETMHKDGGLPITIKVNLNGTLSFVGGYVKMSFPKDRFTSKEKLNIELAQRELPFSEGAARPPGKSKAAGKKSTKRKAKKKSSKITTLHGQG